MCAKKAGTSKFQDKVYHAVKRIPRGYVTTYGILATQIGCRSCRAVGQALRRNPHAPNVPCHRVIASDLKIGGFKGRTGGAAIHQKKELLNKEGVIFRDGRLNDCSKIYRF